MSRYIDADKLLESLQEELDYYPLLYTREQNEWFDKGLKRALRIVKIFPTADVVPKSEVERWRRNLEAVLEEIPETKREVAREIFEEIEKALNLSKCYGESGIYFEHDIEADIAELKKKYTEEKK